jgi:T-complex protein 1 subunit beta
MQVTNDGATILGAIFIDNPAAKVLVNISKTQDDEVGDGTTTVCVLAAELLREAEKLINVRLHPQTIIAGWRLALEAARAALDGAARDRSGDAKAWREDLLSIARTTLSSKIVHQDKEHFALLCVDAVLRLGGSTDLQAIHIIKKAGGSLRDSHLTDGFVLEKKFGVGQPKRLVKPKILLANTAMDNDRNKIFGVRVRTDSAASVSAIETAERARMLDKCAKIAAHGINLFINRQLIYNLPEQYFADHGIAAIEHADFDGIERLGLVTGGEIVSTFEHPELVKLGTCELVEEIMIGEDQMIRFSGLPHQGACTIVLRGASQQLLDEAERSVHDALCVLSQTAATDRRTVLGGGCSEALMAHAVDAVAARTAGKQALAVEAFSRALRAIPTVLADNAGYDSSELVTRLRAAHATGASRTGLDLDKGDLADMDALGVVESYKSKLQSLVSAAEAAEMILRTDNIFRSAPRKRQGQH